MLGQRQLLVLKRLSSRCPACWLRRRQAAPPSTARPLPLPPPHVDHAPPVTHRPHWPRPPPPPPARLSLALPLLEGTSLRLPPLSPAPAQVNLAAPFLLTEALAPLMPPGAAAAVVHIASTRAVMSEPHCEARPRGPAGGMRGRGWEGGRGRGPRPRAHDRGTRLSGVHTCALGPPHGAQPGTWPASSPARSPRAPQGYAAAKAGLLGLTHAQAASLAGRARVNCVLPGWIDTSGDAASLRPQDHAWHWTGACVGGGGMGHAARRGVDQVRVAWIRCAPVAITPDCGPATIRALTGRRPALPPRGPCHHCAFASTPHSPPLLLARHPNTPQLDDALLPPPPPPLLSRLGGPPGGRGPHGVFPGRRRALWLHHWPAVCGRRRRDPAHGLPGGVTGDGVGAGATLAGAASCPPPRPVRTGSPRPGQLPARAAGGHVAWCNQRGGDQPVV